MKRAPAIPTEQARRDIATFLALLAAFSGVFYGLVLLSPGARAGWLSYAAAFMWCPGLAALATQLLRHRSLRGLGWGPGRPWHYLFAYALPLGLVLPVYLLTWSTGMGSFDHQALEAARSQVGAPQGLAGDAVLVLLAALLAPAGIVATLGEEIGWRGLLVPRLASLTSLTKTSLITGAIWALWHYPIQIAVLPIFLPGLPVWYATICFTVSVIAISFIYTWLRVRSDSVWPAALLHAASNSFMGAFERLTKHGELTSYFTYEYGAGLSIVIALAAIPFWRRLRAMDLARVETGVVVR